MNEPSTIADLTPDPRNARKHNERNVGAITSALSEVGAARSIVIDEFGVVLAGNATIQAAGEAGITKLRVVDADGATLVAVRRSGLTVEQKARLALFDNRSAELADGWNADVLDQLQRDGVNLSDGLWSEDELAELFAPTDEPRPGRTDPDDIPDQRRTSIEVGDAFELGAHRLICGDTRDATLLGALFGDARCSLIHADPPYGMGKEADGIVNDNLYREKLDAFQMEWWRAWMGRLEDNGSAYVWGDAPNLWRLWYVGGLCEDEGLIVRNEIVWDKASVPGMASEGAHSYPPATERCLFLMRGQQFLGNQNKADYWHGFEPLRAWLESERDKAGWVNSDVNRVTGTHMAGHWFSQSQFAPISRKHYAVLEAAAEGRAFTEPYDELFDRLFPEVRAGGNQHRRELAAAMRESRSYFDNAHEAMTDVWQFPRVVGEERFGHATPKPVAMVARAIRSSCEPGGAVGVPFGGTGPEFIAAEQLQRRAFGVEINPEYCQIIIDRWEAFTGRKAVRVVEAVLG